jgi:hypothetical protein
MPSRDLKNEAALTLPVPGAAAPWSSNRKSANVRKAAQMAPTIKSTAALSRQSLLPGTDRGTDMTASWLTFVR